MNTRKVVLAKPLLGAEEQRAASEVLASGWLTQGPKVAEFEAAFARYTGAPHACAVSNCTTALHLALEALGVAAGDEVVTVSHSYVATANAIRYCGAAPVFIDVEEDTFNMDPSLLEEAITPRTKAVLAVHQMGLPCDLPALAGICRRRGVPLVEDAACAAGSKIRIDGEWAPIGRPFGDIACFSFHPRKVMTTGEGGMLTCASPAHDRKFRLLRQHGMDLTDLVRHQSAKVVFEDHVEVGYNYRMSDILAAVGIVQLSRLESVVENRRTRADEYRERLKDFPHLRIPSEPRWARSNWQSFCAMLSPDAPVGRDLLMQKLQDRGIASRRGVMNAHEQTAYAGWKLRFALPRSEAARQRGLMLPMPNDMSTDDVDYVCEALRDILS